MDGGREEVPKRGKDLGGGEGLRIIRPGESQLNGGAIGGE